MEEKIKFDFLKSAFTFTNVQEILNWVKNQNEVVSVNVNKTPFKNLKNWNFDDKTGSLVHDSGKFFSIQGIRVNSSLSPIFSWDQPIINQPEIGYLGFIVKKINNVLHFLIQAKIEPGNINYVQLSPTLQATKSNFEQVHKGKKPLYLDFFKNAKKENILLDQLQSEQGSRFLKKRNRNIIVQVDDDFEKFENFRWVTLGDIKELIGYDNVVNMDTRTVISGIDFGDLDNNLIDFINDTFIKKTSNNFLKSTLSLSSFVTNSDVISFITDLKSKSDLYVEKISLNDSKNWIISENEIKHIDNKYFKIIGVEVVIGNREVVSWCQPMVEPMSNGICAFVSREIDGVIHFAVQAKLECGNHDIIELAPTVQTLTGDLDLIDTSKVPFLDYVLNADPKNVIFDCMQSEEGGRFYREQNRNLIILDNSVNLELPENFIWMTLNQINKFIKYNNYFNIQSRSLVSAITFN
jgi:oxidase EvaA